MVLRLLRSRLLKLNRFGNTILFLLLPSLSLAENRSDSSIFNRVIEKNSVSDIALSFLGTPYVPSVLESGDDKNVVVNLSEVDCVTFVESVAAIYLCVKNKESNFSDFVKYLSSLRYRNGKPEGYGSRLHYFSEWLVNNKDKGYIEFLTADSLSDFKKPIFFMSANASLYKHLKNQQNLVEIKNAEQRISSYNLKYIPANKLADFENKIISGDLIAFTTTIKGLDIVHVAIAYRPSQNSDLHFIHASTTDKKVVISKEKLREYIEKNKRIDGVMVARIK